MASVDVYDVIRVRGARENNLVDVDIDIAKHAVTVFTGVSGSGKSSLVFSTVAAESQRLINETYSTFLQSFMATPPRPDVDVLDNLSATIVVDQERMGANIRSTVGTATDAHALLRILFSRLANPYVGPPGHFSFNLPQGMCPACEGTGRVSAIDEEALLDSSKSLNEGAILAPSFGVGTGYWKVYGEAEQLDPDKKIADYRLEERDWLLHHEPTRVKLGELTIGSEGLVRRIRRLFLDRDQEAKQSNIRAFVDRIATFTACGECAGTRLNEAARSATLCGHSLAALCQLEIRDLATVVGDIDDPSVAPVVASLTEMFAALTEVGLGYLSLDRESGTLSGGEAQRVKMVRHLGSALTDLTYVFDEPTVGLHPHDIANMNELLLRLRDKGNTILVVEHKPEVMAIADRIVDLGPGAGTDGGRVTFVGSYAELRGSDTVTGRSLEQERAVRAEPRKSTGVLSIRDATSHNLKHVSVDVPTGVLTVVTGVAGSGKSSLIHGSLSDRDGVLVVDQSAIRGSRRSSPATYTGLLDPIRSAFAKANGVKPALFSANSAGACPVCKGLGVLYTDLAVMAGVAVPCEECGGKRFTAEVLQYTLHGRTIDEVLRLSMGQAAAVFTTGPAARILRRLIDVGLAYLTLGQPLTTLSGGERQRLKLAASLSGGERQRLKLAASLSGGASTYILDEPTSGLHLADTRNLVGLLHRLVESGKTAVVIEHNLAVIAQADWLIDIGPGAGHDGGEVVFQGTPADMIAQAETLTGRHLKRWYAGKV